jgi:hypothetical protein
MADPNDPNRPAYPPQQGGYPPQQGYPSQQGGGYPPQQGGYPPQGGYGPQPGYPPQQGGYPPPGFPPHPQPQRAGLPAYRIVLGIVGVIGIALGIYGLATSGVFGGRGGGSTANNAATMPYSGNGNVLASSAIDDDIAERVRAAAAQMKSRLPQQAGPITITEAYHLKQLPKDLNIGGKFPGTLDQQTWLPMANRFSQELCKGPTGDLVRSGARIHLQVVDKVRSSYFLDVRSC